MSDFDKSDQKKTEYVLLDTWNGQHHQNGRQQEMRKAIHQQVTREIEKRPHMQLVIITPFSYATSTGGHSGLHLLFEEREHNLDSIREDIMEIRKEIERIRQGLVGRVI